ncbi:hypothetical protein QBC46DRAFT_377746 [Diplogelasinospora grovesii]|uniref:Uncharacterized protein n=1 Tax=Diplogelasinospora grovesii TaxID=303347 RepID=A0AAN6S7Z4_9PEZI|nr:hypothetical protein QBC46DRAFT_377746 [Diplogelasinospora grovesii]
MSQGKAQRLMLRTCDPPYMRVADVLLDLDTEANPAANAMYIILKDEYEWKWPDRNKHLMGWKDNREEFVREVDEDDGIYRDRMRRWQRWPQLKSKRQEQWLRCAIITFRALDYLSTVTKKG